MHRFAPAPPTAPDVVAVLGPTNTGKTHRAISEMLRHPTGMLGLPLRLLAREVYDRVTAQVGEADVALMTGEEKRVPPEARYWICTTEAMPNREVDFLGVDEIQLCGSRDRGHVFTDRLLNARGRRVTMFMGADTIGPLLNRLVPEVRCERHDRFSRLHHVGPRRLAALPPRSAVIAFRADDVYELADRLRERHGGAAVVLGALSPRARNAQVAMYQAGEVQYLVATDAIGMGLNLDLDQVAFWSLSKWDGREHRPLAPDEIGQIAGRAGRYRRDGRFGPLTSAGPLPPDVVEAVRTHRYPAQQRLRWRNSDLDFASVDALLHSLEKAPPRSELVSAPRADDHRALAALRRDPLVQPVATTPRTIRLLWDVCCIPDYRKDLAGGHHQLLAAIHGQLAGDGGRLEDDWLAQRVDRLDRLDGDIEVLMDRIARVRTWNYVSFRGKWVRDAAAWQARTRQVEDRLSDALHEALSQRFVDRRAVVLLGDHPGEVSIEVSTEGRVTAEGLAVGHLSGFLFLLAAGVAEAEPLRRAVVRLLRTELADRVERCVQAEHAAFELDDQGQVLWEGTPVARLEKGRTSAEPRVKMSRQDLLAAGARQRIQRRLVAWSRDLEAELLRPLRPPVAEQLSPAGRGLLFALEQGLGTVRRRDVRDQVGALSRADRRRLVGMDVRLGTEHVYSAAMLGPDSVAIRAVLAGTALSGRPLAAPPPPSAPSTPQAGSPRVYTAMGYPVLGGRAVRVDLLERLAAEARALGRTHDAFEAPEEACDWLGCTPQELARILVHLGYRQGEDGRFTRQRAPRRRGRNRR